MNYKTVELKFQNIPIRVLVESEKSYWLCVYDICLAIRRPSMLRTDPVFNLCPTACKMVFGHKKLWCIRPRDIEKLIRFVRNENKTIQIACEKLMEWKHQLPELIKSLLNETEREDNGQKKPVSSICTMSSLQIAELTNKQHKDVLKAIRKMEPAWKKITERNFSLSEYKDSTGRKLPYYILNKAECLYIATKFNDEARAKLVVRWEELEKEIRYEQFQVPSNFKEALLLAAKQQDQIELQNKVIEKLGEDTNRMKPKELYYDAAIKSRTHFSTSSIAGELNMSYHSLIKKLECLNIITYSGKNIVAKPDYESWMEKTTVKNCNRSFYQWTKAGREGIFNVINPQMPK